MMRAGKAPVFMAIAAAFVCLLSVGSIRAQGAQQPPLVSEKLFRNIQVLKGMPIDTFFDAMGMFAASMGDDCTYCHSKEESFSPCLLSM